MTEPTEVNYTTYLYDRSEKREGWLVWSTSRSLSLALHTLGSAPRGEYYVTGSDGYTVASVTLISTP